MKIECPKCHKLVDYLLLTKKGDMCRKCFG